MSNTPKISVAITNQKIKKNFYTALFLFIGGISVSIWCFNIAISNQNVSPQTINLSTYSLIASLILSIFSGSYLVSLLATIQPTYKKTLFVGVFIISFIDYLFTLNQERSQLGTLSLLLIVIFPAILLKSLLYLFEEKISIKIFHLLKTIYWTLLTCYCILLCLFIIVISGINIS